jgi:DNA repair exonuclease SbcCD ATPase subunit
MKCTRIIINSFMGIGSADLELADKGLVAVQGVNLDDSSAKSNGAGKSSFADALFWCCYGETARDGLGADEVINRTAGKDCHVSTEWLEEDGGRYLIQRWRKKKAMTKPSGSSLTYYPPGSTPQIDLTQGTDKLTQVEIDKALGCTKEVFVAAVYAGQEKMPNLPAMSDSDLKQLIEKASGVDVLVTAYAIARQKLKDAELDHDRWRANHVRSERDVTDTKVRHDELIKRRDGFEGQRKTDLKVLGEQLREAVARAREEQRKRDDVVIANVQAKIDKLDEAINAVHLENDEEAKLLNIERDAAAKNTSAQAIYNRAVEDARAQKTRLDNIASQVGKPCGECGKPYETHDLAGASSIAKEKTRDLVARAQELKSDLEERAKTLAQASTALAKHRENRTDIRATVDERKRLAELLAQRRRAEDALERETDAARRVRTQIDTLKAQDNPYVDLETGAKRDLDEAVDAFHKSEKEGVDCERRVMVCKDVVKVYAPSGVRAHILDNVTPFLNDRTADYLGVMSDGNISAVWSTLTLNAKKELTEKFAINVQKDVAGVSGGGSFASLSGGEKRKVRLACALALQDLVASRATKPIELFVGDEIDDAMDDAGLERLMAVLEAKARERGTLLIISHNSLNDWCRQVVTVTMSGGVSTITGCLEGA